MTILQYNFYPTLTPVRVASTSNVAGSYLNGSNGVGATLTVAATSLTIDSVVVAVGDRVLLHTQTNTFEQGIYVVESIGSTVVLKRSDDMNDAENFLHSGLSVGVGAGSINAGNFYTLVEPLPGKIGVDAIVFNADPSAGGVSFSGPASSANALAVFADTAGNIKAQSVASTLGFGLTISTGNFAVSAGTITSSGAIQASAGNVSAGSSGNAASLISFPATAANGTLIISALNAGGAFNTTVRNSVMGQSSVISIPDPGAATASFVLTASAGTQSLTGALTVAGAIASTAGNITSGSSGDAGSFISFPVTAANGTFIFEALNAGGAFNTTIRNSVMGQSTVYSLSDIGAATGNIPVATGAINMKKVADAAAAGGSATQNFVDAFCTAASVVLGHWQTQATPASILTINPGVGSFDVVSTADAGVGTFNYVIMK